MYCTRHVSEITFIRYAQCQTIGITFIRYAQSQTIGITFIRYAQSQTIGNSNNIKAYVSN
jgi:hypothetical protein